MNIRRTYIKNDLVYKMRNKYNSKVNNNGQEFIKFTKSNSHQVKQDNKATNHVSNFNANASYMPYHAFDASYVLMRNEYGKVIVYGGPHHKWPNTCVWVLKVLVTNVKGLK
jgi:hypothetical protein